MSKCQKSAQLIGRPLNWSTFIFILEAAPLLSVTRLAQRYETVAISEKQTALLSEDTFAPQHPNPHLFCLCRRKAITLSEHWHVTVTPGGTHSMNT